jgi:ADP-ribosylglycohydrolase
MIPKPTTPLLGAICGDVIGSVHEFERTKTAEFPLLTARCRFTDDSVMTVAVAAALLGDGDYASSMRSIGRRYPDCGYGGRFGKWVFDSTKGSLNSWGNGSAMRVSAVVYARNSVEDVLAEAKASAEVTHDHPEGIKKAIRDEITKRFGYDLKRTVDGIRPGYHVDVSCQGSVPEAIIAFLDSSDYEDAIRKAISLGGDADTLACICGAIAQPFYGGVPAAIVKDVWNRLTPDLQEVVERFAAKFGG